MRISRCRPGPISFLSLLGSIAVSQRVEAASMTYRESTTASGTIGSTSFTDVPVSFTQTADTSQIALLRSVGLGANLSVAGNTSSQVTIGGVGTFNLTVPTATYNFASSSGQGGDIAVGLQNDGSGSDHGVIYLGLFGKDMQTGPSFDPHNAWGPVMAPTLGVGWPITTDGGVLTLKDVAPNGTFVAELTPVPEPSSLCVAGLLTVAVMLVRRGWRRS